MLIEKLTLRNFKCFEDIDVEFHPNMTVIVGINGSGKTSVMEGVAIAVSTMFAQMDGLSSIGINKGQVRIKTFISGSTKDIQAQYPIEVSAEARTDDGKSVSWKRSLNSPKGKLTIVDAKEITDLGKSFQERLRRGDTGLILPVIAYYGTGRLWDYHREKQKDVFKTNSRINGYIDCVDGRTNVKLMMNWFAKMTVQKYQNQELGMDEIHELNAVYSAMESCYRRITGCEDVKIQYSMGTKELDVAYKEQSGEWMRIPLNQLSDGYKSTISLIADIAYRMAVLNPHLRSEVCTKTNGVVIIDEVDLHLHPAWQRRILGDLRAIFPRVQFIVSTHAPSVINTVKKENIIIIDNGEAFEPSWEMHGRDVNTIVSSLMNVDERPSEIKRRFGDFYSSIDVGDVQSAETELNELKKTIGDNDPEIVGCNVKLSLLKARLKR